MARESKQNQVFTAPEPPGSKERTTISIRQPQFHEQKPKTPHLIHKLHRFFPFDTPDGAHLLVVEQDTVEFVRGDQHLGSERRRDELRSVRKRLDHI